MHEICRKLFVKAKARKRQDPEAKSEETQNQKKTDYISI
jgi:hypothetical protein